jgi:hypothetical protein
MTVRLWVIVALAACILTVRTVELWQGLIVREVEPLEVDLDDTDAMVASTAPSHSPSEFRVQTPKRSGSQPSPRSSGGPM